MPPIDEDTMKRAVKEAIKEWLNEQFARFGKWSLAAIGAMALAAITYILVSAGKLP